MKKITKTKEPDFYTNFIKKEKPQNWGNVGPIKEELRLYILAKEQMYQCAYTGLKLNGNNENSHIDHFRKRSMFHKETFKYDNLFVSTNNESFGAKHKDKHIKESDYSLLINPALENPEDHMEYSLTGRIFAKDNSEKGAKTIDLFHLNHEYLVKRRKNKIIMFNNYNKQLNINELIIYIEEFEGMIRNLCNKII